ncbi:winged helix-turn-helix domain-containing protein [Dyella sp. LX-66]|uniref:winged helix-turn-helix domain-containing protein n=1 Tax=unclassified Dyella TaxID=2634549 RepID=UPI001BDFBEBF|nr:MULTISPECIES: winged helix-turn-helix domain-containing protein [unclassified Dyella]MBT2117583.1 winged helix-turn-helix domain-containing protein [Dyella sp. LX-1]MBT2141413.1 winged helix-turn-helix domain-containing protein [Dyella sp. LX-66]
MTTTYRFGAFELHPQARELLQNGDPVELTASAFDCLAYLVEHRERAVGKDELIAAVWGSTEISDNLLAQTIVRLRRVLGDNADEQRCIKTLPRVGYRWVMATSMVSDAPSPPAEGGDEPVVAARRTPSPRRRRVWWGVALLLVVAVAGFGAWHFYGRARQAFKQGTAVVLPAQIHAPEEWSWLRLGLMDLIVGDLRGARVPVEGSQAVVNMLDRPEQGGTASFASYALVIQPQVTLDNGRWHVQLDASVRNGSALHAEAYADNMLKAAHEANAFLLAQLGAGDSDRVASDDDKEQYLLRMEAASHTGTLKVLRELIDNAPADLRTTPEFAYAKVAFYCDQGEYEECKTESADLLDRLPARTQPVLRARTLAKRWYVYFREHRHAQGAQALLEAIDLLKQQNNTGYLAYAYAQRAELLNMVGRFDEAEADFGDARVNYALAGDTAGAVGIDESLAELSMQRGHFAQAVPAIQRAVEQYQRMGMRQYLPPLLVHLVISQKMLLQHADAFATTEQYWPLDEKFPGYTENIGRHILMFQRADALGGIGRAADASALLEQVLVQIEADPHGEPGLKGTVYTLLAKLALQRGDVPGAQAWIAKALSGRLLEWDSDQHDTADAWLLNVLIAQQAGDVKEIQRALPAMQAWADKLAPADRDDWVAIQLLRAQAAQAQAEDRREQALDLLKQAMNRASRYGVPELIADTGLAYTLALLESGKASEAFVISGQLSAWGQLDWRVAWAQACVYRAMGQTASWNRYQRKARELAGDRVLPAPPAKA